MIKRAPTLGRLAVMTVFVLSCFGLLLYLWIAFGGSSPLKPQGYQFKVRFPEAVQLANQGDVRIAGVPVGKIVRVEPAGDNRTEATIQMRSRYAPVASDMRAILRAKSLLGETYVELTPGKGSAPKVPDGGMLANGAVAKTVELDEVFRTFDAKTRRDWQVWAESQAVGVAGRGEAINAAFGNLPGFVTGFDELLRKVNAQERAVMRAVDSTGVVFSSISARDGELRGLITDSNKLFKTTAARDDDLADIFRALPRFEYESRITLPKLTAFAKRAQPIVEDLQPAASEFAPTFNSLSELAPEFRSFFTRLPPLITATKRGVPAFESVMRELPPLFEDFQPFLRNLNPSIEHIDQNKREVTALIANGTAATLGRDLNLPRTKNPVQYLRTGNPNGPQALSFFPRPLGSSRQNGYPAPGSVRPGDMKVLNPATCNNGDAGPPESADPESLTPLIPVYALRTTTRDIARPGCQAQGNYPGHSTIYPQLRAEP